VRNTCYSRLQRGKAHALESEFDDEFHSPEPEAANPALLFERSRDQAALQKALEDLSEEFREVIVLRELQGMAYKEIADVVDIPIGTVMSRLARGRKSLQLALTAQGPMES
jgi:RNA polymerase sigma-70 factor (ECF subfamily)